MFGSAAAREVISRATGLKPASERLLHRLLLSPGCGEYGDAKREKRCEDASHSTALRAKSPVACFIFAKPWGRPRVVFQHGGCAVANNAFTDSRESVTIVKTPRIVPNGIKRHSTQAITSAKV